MHADVVDDGTLQPGHGRLAGMAGRVVPRPADDVEDVHLGSDARQEMVQDIYGLGHVETVQVDHLPAAQLAWIMPRCVGRQRGIPLVKEHARRLGLERHSTPLKITRRRGESLGGRAVASLVGRRGLGEEPIPRLVQRQRLGT